MKTYHLASPAKGAALVALAAGLALGASAQNWPLRPVRIVVPFVPGGGTDVVRDRLLQVKMILGVDCDAQIAQLALYLFRLADSVPAVGPRPGTPPRLARPGQQLVRLRPG